jgi:GNAT superfamily N-acetyltransferase
MIRDADERDVPKILKLVSGLAEFEKLPGPDDGAAERMAEHLRAGKIRLMVAELDGDLAAYAAWFYSYSTFLARPGIYLEDLYVRPDARSRGIGEQLLRTLAARAHAEGCGRFEWTVLDWNVRAQAFYTKMGARMLGEWRVCRVDGDALTRLAAK